MTTPAHIDVISLFSRLARAASITVTVLGSLVLLGWAFDVAVLKNFFAVSGDMKPNAALAFILSALALWLSARESDARLILVARILAAVVALIGLLTLAEHVAGLDLGIDQILFIDPSTEARPGRMDPATTGILILMGVELSMLAAALDARTIQLIALATGILSLLALAGYLYGFQALYAVGPHTAAGFLILSLGVLCARPGAGLLATVTNDHAGGLATLRLLAGAVGVPLLLGYLTVLGRRLELYDWPFGLALFALSNTGFITLMIFRHAHSLARTDLERNRSERQLRRDLEHGRVLREIDRALYSAPESSAFLDVVLEKIERAFPFATAGAIRLLNRESGELEPAASRNPDEGGWSEEEKRALGARAQKVLQTKAPVTARNVQTDTQTANARIYRKRGLVSYLGVPLLARGEALGVLDLYTKEERAFTQEEIEFLGSLAGKAALSICLARPAEKIDLPVREPEPANVHLNKSLQLLPSLYAALAPLSASESIAEIIDGVVERLMEATGADAALIRVWKKETGASLVTGYRGFSEDHVKQMEFTLLAGAVEWVVQHGEPIIAADIAAEPRFKTKVQQQLGFRSSATLPLKINNAVCGIVHLSSRTPGRFDEGQKDLLVAIAQQMSVALENRQLFENLKTSRDELEKASKVQDEFLSVMSHELRTPLSVVMGYAGMIKEKMLGEINPQQEDALQKLLTRGNDQLTMINAIMQITQLESRALVLERHLVNLAELLGHLKSDYALSHTKAQVGLVWEYPSEPVAIVTDGGKLKEILVNLINNAIKFTPQGSVTVSMRLTEDPRRKWVELKIADTGVGIAEEQFSRIFDKFYQVDSSQTRLYGGTGLGLYIVKHFTEFLGGKLHVASEPGKGSTFTVNIPYAT
jgi:signal transduction histidine kinase